MPPVPYTNAQDLSHKSFIPTNVSPNESNNLTKQIEMMNFVRRSAADYEVKHSQNDLGSTDSPTQMSGVPRLELCPSLPLSMGNRV